jgi:ribosomal protein L37AE/L43A
MILVSEIEIILRNRDIPYYRKLGYNIPITGRYGVKCGTKITVKIKDLKLKSRVIVPCACDNCGKIRKISYQKYRGLCHKCAGFLLKGYNHPFFGKHQTEQTKEKLRLANLGKRIQEETKEKLRKYSGELHSMFGKPKSESTKEKIRKTLKGKYVRDKSFTWNPLKTDEERLDDRKYLEYAYWRTKVYLRDNYTCQKCSVRGGKLEAHHKESYCDNKLLRIVVENGITLCKTCHRSFHKIYGKKPNSEQLKKWLCVLI